MKRKTNPCLVLALVVATLPTIAFSAFDEGAVSYQNKDFATAFKELLPVAQDGNRQAQQWVGDMYLNGTGVAKNATEALHWLSLSAEQGDVKAMALLGHLYVQGIGVAQDMREAENWFRRAGSPTLLTSGATPRLPMASTPVGVDLLPCRRVPPLMPRAAINTNAQGVVQAGVLLVDGIPKDVIIFSGPKVFHETVRQALLQYECWKSVRAQLGSQEFVFQIEPGPPRYDVHQIEPVFNGLRPSYNADWRGLSAEQRQIVRAQYGSLTPDVEPPYPVDGMAELLERIRLAAEQLGAQGRLRLNVTITGTGSVESIAVLESPSSAFSKSASSVLYRTAFKGAVCNGQACTMEMPVHVMLTKTDNQDKRSGLEKALAAANQGIASAQNYLGTLYQFGRDAPKDLSQAAFWYCKAAEQGLAQAQNKCGKALRDGSGVPKDLVEGIKWLQKSADQGDADGQFSLGLAYMNGTGVAQNPVESVRWYQQSAEQGHPSAQNNLADAYENGLGVPMDMALALQWYRLSADQKNRVAIFSLSHLYRDGRGVPADPVQATSLLRQSAELGYPDAQFEMAQRYADGNGVAKNDKIAIEWYQKAAKNDHQDAIDKLRDMGLAQ